MTRLPLHTVRVVVTRPKTQTDTLCARLQALGATPILFPTIQIEPVRDTSAMDRAVRQLSSYDWVIFTSVNGVSIFERHLRESGWGRGAVRVAAVGAQTAQALTATGLPPTFVPTEYIAERIVEGLGDVQGQSILMPRGQLARRTLPRLLRARGARVDTVTVYRTVRAVPDEEAWVALRQGFEAILFTSASTVRHFAALVGEAVCDACTDAVVGCIGPITTQAARRAGLPVQVVPTTYTTASLVDALAAFFHQTPSPANYEARSCFHRIGPT